MPTRILLDKMQNILIDNIPVHNVKETFEKGNMAEAMIDANSKKGELLVGEYFRIHECNHDEISSRNNKPCRILGRVDR